MLEHFIAVIAPHTCAVCGVEGGLLCDWCVFDSIEPVPSRCYRCLRLSIQATTCGACRSKTPLESVWVRTLYDGAARRLLYALKFARAKMAARTIALLLDEAIPYIPEDMVITYIPTATRRVRIRGYDQTKLIAQELARLRGLRCKRLLIRHGQTRQVGATRAIRARQALQNYSAVKTEGTTSVLLVDDILTTGATLESAAKILKNAGIRHVYSAAFAQKQ